MKTTIGAAGLLLAVLSGCGSGGSDVSRGTFAGSPGLCGIPDMYGERIDRIRGEGACGVARPVRITAVGGIALTGARATVNCDTAEALSRWVERAVKPATRRANGGVASMRVAASYSCRTRNSQRGAKLSEHAKGNAIDISSFTFADGTVLTVEDDWGNGQGGRMLSEMHRKACGPFTTVLGPNADRFHQDHFHFDVEKRRSGTYCR